MNQVKWIERNSFQVLENERKQWHTTQPAFEAGTSRTTTGNHTPTPVTQVNRCIITYMSQQHISPYQVAHTAALTHTFFISVVSW